MKFLPLAALLFASLALPARATDALLVSVYHSGHDPTGDTLVFFLKDALRASPSFKLMGDDEKQFHLDVRVTTMDPGVDQSGYSTIYSLVVLLNGEKFNIPAYLSSSVGTCGSKRIKECADNIAASIGEVADKWIR